MLILSRKQGEAILVDGGIRIVVLATDNGGVRLGIEAPSEVGIVREEIVERIADENRRAGATEAGRKWLSTLTGTDGSTPAAEGDGGKPDGTASDASPSDSDPNDGA